MKKVKVLHIIGGLGNGGAERQLIELLRFNKKHGVLILTDVGIYKNTLNKLKISYWELGVKNKFLILFKIVKFFKIIKLFNPDIIQSWMYNACLLSTIYKLLNTKKIKLIWCIRCSNMITKYYSFSLQLTIIICKVLSFKADRIVYNSISGMKHHAKLGFSKKKQKVIYNGFDGKKFNRFRDIRTKLRKELDLHFNDKVIIFVARVDPMKNHNNFLKAFEKAKKFKCDSLKLVLIGKGTDLLNLPDHCTSLGMKLNVEKYYNLADFIILPSSFGEGFSNVLVEGMLSELYPIATNVGDAKTIIGKTGLIIPKAEEKYFIQVLKKIAKTKKNIIFNSGRASRKRAKELFSSVKMKNSYENLYKGVL